MFTLLWVCCSLCRNVCCSACTHVYSHARCISSFLPLLFPPFLGSKLDSYIQVVMEKLFTRDQELREKTASSFLGEAAGATGGAGEGGSPVGGEGAGGGGGEGGGRKDMKSVRSLVSMSVEMEARTRKKGSSLAAAFAAAAQGEAKMGGGGGEGGEGGGGGGGGSSQAPRKTMSAQGRQLSYSVSSSMSQCAKLALLEYVEYR